MLDGVFVTGSRLKARDALVERVDRLTRRNLPENAEPASWALALATACFSPPLPVRFAGMEVSNGHFSADVTLPETASFPAAVPEIVLRHVGELPSGAELSVTLEIDRGAPCFIAALAGATRRETGVEDNAPGGSSVTSRPPSPVGQPPVVVTQWFDGLTTLVVPERDGTLKTAREGAEAYAQGSKAANTMRAYRSAVRGWCLWARSHSLPALPARSDDLAAYFADMAMKGRSMTTIELHRAALRYLHHLAGVTVPTAHAEITTTLAGIRRKSKTPLPQPKTALTWDRLCVVLEAIDTTSLAGARDCAVLLLGFAGAFRRSELAGLEVRDITLDEDGMTILLRASKGDVQRLGARIGIPRGITRNCPVLAYERWLRLSGITEGPVFRRIRVAPKIRPGALAPPPRIGTTALWEGTIAEIVQKRCAAVGLEGDFAGHSLRRGAISTGAADGFDLLELKRFSRHRSLQVVETYIDEASVKARNPGRGRF